MGGIQRTSFQQQHLDRNHWKDTRTNHLEKGGEGETVVNQTHHKEGRAVAA